MKTFCYILSLCVFLSVVFSSQILADTKEIQATLDQALAKAEKQTLGDPLGGRHLVFAYAAVTAPTGYANILMNLARDPAVRQVVLAEQDKMERSVRDTEMELMRKGAKVTPGSHPKVDWMVEGFRQILTKGFFPPQAVDNASLFMQLGQPNAYTWTLGPNNPKVNVYDSLINIMPQDAVLGVLGHELGHNQGLHIWVQVIWGAIADKFGRIIIPTPDGIPGDIFSGIPEGVASKFSEEQRGALRKYFSGMSRADLDARLSQRLDHIVEFIREDHESRTGNVRNHDPFSPDEIQIRSELAQVIKRVGDRLYKMKGRDGFMLWAAQLAENVMDVEQIENRLLGGAPASAGVKIDKKVSSWAVRLQEYHADLLGLINLYHLFDGDLDRAIKAAATADSILAGGMFTNTDGILAQAKELADILRVNPVDEAKAYEGIHMGMQSHSDSVVRAGMYVLFAESPAFKIVTDPFNRALWIYSELRRAMDREVRQGQMAGEAVFVSEWAQGEARLQKLLDSYEEPLLKAFKEEAVEISLGNKMMKGSLYARLFRFMDLYREAQKTDSPKVWGRWDWNVSNAIGGPETFLAELRYELQKLIAELRKQDAKNGKQIKKLVQIDGALGQAGISPPNASLEDRLVAQLDAEPGSPEGVIGNIRPRHQLVPEGGRWPQPTRRSLACGGFLVSPDGTVKKD